MDDLLAGHAEAVYRYALRLTRHPASAADLLQETMLRGWQQRGRLREPAAARTWLLRIASNLHRDGLRATRYTAPLEPSEIGVVRLDDADRIEQRECVEQALAALDELPARQRQVMHLVTIEQLSPDEAAVVLEISVEAVRASLSLARQTLRERLKDIYDDVRGARRE